jgi:hypothetical protein
MHDPESGTEEGAVAASIVPVDGYVPPTPSSPSAAPDVIVSPPHDAYGTFEETSGVAPVAEPRAPIEVHSIDADID